MTATPYGASVKGFREEERPARAIPMLRVDPLLFLATLGLVGFGIYTIYTATSGDIPGNAYYYVIRRGGYGGVGDFLMLLVLRFEYPRLREWRWGIFGLMLLTILMTLALGTASHG